MKKVFLSILAVAALASCVQSEEVGFNNPIDFGAPFVGNTTKAADPSYGTPQKDGEGNLLPESPVALKKFNVYGTVQGTGAGVVNIFKGVEVTGEVGKKWTYDEKYNQFWIPGATYNFAAVVDATVDTDDNGMPKTLTTVAISDTDPSKCFLKDMLYDKADEIQDASANQAAVNFAFEHLLAKAQFVVTSTTKDGYYYNVKGIKIHNFAQGTYTIKRETWDVITPVAYDLGDISNVTAANTNQTNATQVLLIPTATTFKVEFIVELRNSNGVDANGNPKDVLLRTINCTGDAAKVVDIKDSSDNTIGLQAGHAYNFNLALTAGSLIEFTVTNNPAWATPSDDVNLGL